MNDAYTNRRQQQLKGKKFEPTVLKNVAILALIFIAYGVVGRMDFDDEMRAHGATQAQTSAVKLACAK